MLRSVYDCYAPSLAALLWKCAAKAVPRDEMVCPAHPWNTHPIGWARANRHDPHFVGGEEADFCLACAMEEGGGERFVPVALGWGGSPYLYAMRGSGVFRLSYRKAEEVMMGWVLPSWLPAIQEEGWKIV